MNRKEALQHMLDGGIIELGERYNKIENGKIYYSDYGINNWKESNQSIEEFENANETKFNKV